jgi:hypothetical protein
VTSIPSLAGNKRVAAATIDVEHSCHVRNIRVTATLSHKRDNRLLVSLTASNGAETHLFRTVGDSNDTTITCVTT